MTIKTVSHSAYQELANRFLEIKNYQHLLAMADWDHAAVMPGGGNEARVAAIAQLEGLIHEKVSASEMEGLIQQAEASDLSEMEKASVKEMRRDWHHAVGLPKDLVEKKSAACKLSEHAWRELRPQNDWAGFLTVFKPVLKYSRQEANILSQQMGLSPYDAMMDAYEPGSRSERIDAIFNPVKEWLPGLIQQVTTRQAQEIALEKAVGPFDIARQKDLGQDVMRLLGFNFNHGRLDESTHPFCGGVPEDVRITTRYTPDDFVQAMMGIVHETGHARYEQNLPLCVRGLPAGRARSMGMHESQSLSFEMQLGAHPGFQRAISPLLKKHLGDQKGFNPEVLAFHSTRVNPGLIRVDADELTYPAHIILRYEIERDLINGILEAEDIPAVWNEKMKAYLGQDTAGDYNNGPMQDVHWPCGLFGYFPSYTLGAMTAAQLMRAVRVAHPHLDEEFMRGDFSSYFGWLQENVWQQGSLLGTDELMIKATGETLNPLYFKQHLEKRYLGY